MKTNKKQIKKELKKVTKLVSKLTKKKVKKNYDNLVTLHNGITDIKKVVKFVLKQKNYVMEEEVQKDLVVG
jgi:hypothetical protein